MGWFSNSNTQKNEDGSTVDRTWKTETTVRNEDGSVRERSYREASTIQVIDDLFGLPGIQTTEDGDGNVINVQYDYD